MRRMVLLLSSVSGAMLLASGVMLASSIESAQAAFPGQNGNIVYSAFDGNDYEIYTMPATGGTPTPITNNTTYEFYPAYSPDGKTIAYMASDGSYNQIYTIPAGGGTTTKVTTDTTNKEIPEFSPDGSKITYSAYDGTDQEVYVVPAKGGTPVNITNTSSIRTDMHPTFSPDGRTIAYSSYSSVSSYPYYEIFTIPANGGVATQVTSNSSVSKLNPDYSPDGFKIAYSAYDGSDQEIYTVASSGGAPTNITNNTRDDQDPSYSPDGTKIVLYGYDGSVDNEIYSIPASGGARTELTDNTSGDIYPDWGVVAGDPDGTAPETTISSGPDGPTKDNTPTFAFGGSDNTTSVSNLLYSYRTDDGQWSSYSATTSITLGGTTGLSDGEHTFYVKAKDQAGNEDLSPAEETFTVDTAVPGAPTIDSGLLYDNDGNFTVSGSAERDNTVTLYEASTEAGTDTAEEGRWNVPLSGVAEGSHTYTAKANDSAGNPSGPSNVLTVIVDKTAPTVDGATPADAATDVVLDGDVTVTFSETMKPETMSTSTVKLVKEGSSTPVAASVSCDDPCRTVTLDPDGDQLDEGATYTATIKSGSGGAKDLSGNALAENKVWSFTTVDATAPAVALTAPGDGAFVSGSSVALSTEASDNAGIEKVEFLVNGELAGTDQSTENGNSYSMSWDSTTTADGAILVEARAYDTSGQTATSSRTVVVDNAKPTGTVLINNGAASTKMSTVQLTLMTEDASGSGVETMRFSSDGTNWSEWESYTAAKSWTLAKGTGARTVYAEFQDGAGNVLAPPAKDTIKVLKKKR